VVPPYNRPPEENSVFTFIRVNPQPRGEYENPYRRRLGGGF